MHTTTNLVTPTSTESTTTRPFAAGARAISPLVMGAAPYALAIGAASSGLGIDRLTTWVGSWSMVAGTAQLTAMQLLHEGAAPVVALVAALVVNARFAVYSAGLVQWFPTASRRERLLMAFPLVDQVYMTSTAAFQRQPMDHRQRRSFYFGAAAPLRHRVGRRRIRRTDPRRPPPGMARTAQRSDPRPRRTPRDVAHVTPGPNGSTDQRAVVAVAGAHLPVHSVVLVATIAGIALGAVRSES